MATALNDIKDALRAHGFTDMLDSDMEAIINDAYFDVCSRMPWPFLEQTATITLAAATILAPTPANMGSVIAAVLDSTGDKLTPLRSDDFYKRFTGALTTVAQPQYYYFVGDQMFVYPVPDGAYTLTLNYLAIPTTLTNATPGTTDIPLIPDRHRRVITLGALVSANAAEDDTDLAGWFQQQFNTRLATMTQDLWKKQWDMPDTVYAINDGWDNLWE